MRRLTWISFAVALFAFVLPFATVSCGEVRVEPTGAELVLRSAPEAQGPDDPGLGNLVADLGGGLATAAFVAFSLALVAALRGWGDGWVVFAGFTGVAALLALKTRGGGSGGAVVEIDAAAGAYLAGVAGAVGAATAVPRWIRSARPTVPAVGLVLLAAGYVAPAWQADVVSSSYADTLTTREPWRALFWLLPIGVAVVLVVRRDAITRDLTTVALAVLGPTAIVTAHDLWRSWKGETAEPGPGPFLVLLGCALLSSFALRARRGPAERRVAAPARPASAPAAPRSGPAGPGSV